MLKKQIRIKCKIDTYNKINKIDVGDWIDLAYMEDEPLVLKKGDFEIIPLGVSMELPYGYEAHLTPRSSTFPTYGILQTNSCGVIDESYCGDNDVWGMPVYATRPTIIRKGDRICQFRIMKKMPPIKFKKVMSLDNGNRGGFGSTGK